ncbi:MAG TPA: F0F1 ATP synthase subunit B' [Stellaceae bacterium]|jgi:F-type H+-transporting ATPase subunit b|nr:F0F1 ATP synthase subunit B' [Stellaceae bacterium]
MPHAGMPQLLTSTYPAQLLWLAITFIVLYVLMTWLALPKVEAAIAARRNRLDDDLARAERLKSETEAMIAAYQKALNEARAAAQARIQETRERLAAEAAERQHQIAGALAQQIAAAERDIAAAKARALADLRGIALDTARSITEKLTGLPADPSAVAAAVDRVMAERPH